MLTELCNYLKNWFCTDSDKHFSDEITIEDGVLASSFDLKDGQYYRVVGSVFNDGVHQYGNAEDILKDEKFEGYIWCMKVPKDVIDLSIEIDDYNSENGKPDAFVSESYNGYSYTKATDNNGNVATWQNAFATRLRGYKKL